MSKPLDPDEFAKLPPAERYEKLIEFPADHEFKLVGDAGEIFTEAVRAALVDGGCAMPVLTARLSSGGRYQSISCVVRVESGARLAELYEALSAVAGLKYII